MRKRFLLFILLLFPGCVHTLPSPIRLFKQIDELTPEPFVILDQYGAFNPSNFAVFDSTVVISCNHSTDIITAIHLRHNSKSIVLQRGQGPHEVIYISPLTTAGNYLYAVENNQHKLISISKVSDSLDVCIKDISIPGSYTSVIGCTDWIILTGYFSGGHYALYNLKNNSVKYYGHYPLEEKYSHLDIQTQALIYINCAMAIKPDLTRFVCVNYNSGIIEIQGIKENAIFLHKRLLFHDIEVKMKGGSPAVSKTNKNGFFSVTVNDQYIFALYSGKTFEEHGPDIENCEYLMAFDWDGNPVFCKHLSISMKSIHYSLEDHTLYGLHSGEKLMIYKMPIME